MTRRTKVLVLILAFAVAPIALSAGKGRASFSAVSTATMSSTTRISSGASSLGGGGFSRRSGRSGRYAGYYGPVPELDPSRKINEQDCTRPIVLDSGNLRCK